MRKEETLEKSPNLGVIGGFDQILSICRDTSIDRIVVALDERRGKLPLDQLLSCRMKGIQITDGIDFSESLSGKLLVENLRPSALIFSNGFRRNAVIKFAKRGIDVFASLLGLIFYSPICLLIAAAIKLDSPGPVLYRQERVGEDESVFELLKFRSMRTDAEKGGPVWAQVNDRRITRVGRIIRKLRLDEIPQMVNVLRGEMSFVGPRPERPHFVEILEKEIPFYSYRHTVKPGITGWAQIRYPYGASKEEALEKLKYDIYYIKHLSVYLDLEIIFQTIKIMLWGRGAR